MYYLAEALLNSDKFKKTYFLYHKCSDECYRTYYFSSIVELLTTTAFMKEAEFYPETFNSCTILLKSNTRPTYDTVKEQYPELLL